MCTSYSGNSSLTAYHFSIGLLAFFLVPRISLNIEEMYLCAMNRKHYPPVCLSFDLVPPTLAVQSFVIFFFVAELPKFLEKILPYVNWFFYEFISPKTYRDPTLPGTVQELAPQPWTKQQGYAFWASLLRSLALFLKTFMVSFFVLKYFFHQEVNLL